MHSVIKLSKNSLYINHALRNQVALEQTAMYISD